MTGSLQNGQFTIFTARIGDSQPGQGVTEMVGGQLWPLEQTLEEQSSRVGVSSVGNGMLLGVWLKVFYL